MGTTGSPSLRRAMRRIGSSSNGLMKWSTGGCLGPEVFGHPPQVVIQVPRGVSLPPSVEQREQDSTDVAGTDQRRQSNPGAAGVPFEAIRVLRARSRVAGGHGVAARWVEDHPLLNRDGS